MSITVARLSPVPVQRERDTKKGPLAFRKRAFPAIAMTVDQPVMSSSSRPRVSFTIARTKKNDAAAKKA